MKDIEKESNLELKAQKLKLVNNSVRDFQKKIGELLRLASQEESKK